MRRGRRIGKSFYKEETVEIEFEFDDVLEYIEDYATDEECKEIIKTATNGISRFSETTVVFEDNGVEGTFVQELKTELLSLAFKKFSLDELEARLGSRFDLL
jgi:hypothetical protein